MGWACVITSCIFWVHIRLLQEVAAIPDYNNATILPNGFLATRRSPQPESSLPFLQDDLINFGKDDFICDEVVESIVKLFKPGRRGRRLGDEHHGTEFANATKTNPFEHKIEFSCIVDPVKTSTGTTKGIHLELKNVGRSFAKERFEAIAQNKTRLIIRNPMFEGSTLIVPDQTDPEIDGMVSFTSVLEWQSPPKGSPSERRLMRRRKLASSQFGTKSVLIFRITAENGSGSVATPSKTAQEVIDSVFGFNGSDIVNLRSQFKACSYDKLDFLPAEGSELTPYYTASGVDGVIDMTVTVDAPFQTVDIERAAIVVAENKTEDGGLGLDLQEYDHVMLMIPQGSRYKGYTGWIAYAYKPGVESVYNDDEITSALNQLHEIGHNLDLHHSGEVESGGGDGVVEYGDTTCIMGYGNGQDDTHRCFNSAKMAELGWYDNIFSFNPVTDVSFNGKVIGVADYGNATENHTLVVEVTNPISTAENLFLTLNTKKGINLDTGEKDDMVTIVRGKRTFESTLFGALNSDAGTNSLTIENFFNGRSLLIVVDSMGVDGTVNYASVRVELEIENCNVASDCSVGDSNCVTATCNSSNKCEYQTVDGCCGNGICEAQSGETCASCTADCKKPDHCNDLGYFDLEKKCTKVLRYGGTWAPAGHMFDIEAVTDITIYAFEIVYAGKVQLGDALDFVNPEVYVKKGTWVGSQFDPKAWDNVYNNKPLPVVIPNVTCPGPLYDDLILDRSIVIPAGETYGIYITLREPSQLWLRPATNFVRKKWEDVGDTFIENTDIKMKAGVSPEYPFGLYVDFMGMPTYFIGRPKYLYGTRCYSDVQCDDGNALTADFCNSSNECEHAVNTNVNVCGNGICEAVAGESCSTCPEDCKIPSDCGVIGLGINEFGEGWTDGRYRYDFDSSDSRVNGNMFEIQAKDDITIYAFEIYAFRDDYQENEKAQVWTKWGSYAGAELNEDLWTTVLNATVAKFNMERIVLTLDYPVRIPANEKRAFYVAIEDHWTLLFKDGTSVGNPVIEDNSIRILEGVGLGGTWFTNVSRSPTKFFGSVRYKYGHICFSESECADNDDATKDECSSSGGNAGVCSNQVLDNICGNRICESSSPNLETWFGCPKDCAMPDVEKKMVGRWGGDEDINSYNTPKGMMFDLEAITDVTVYGVDVASYSPNSVAEIEIYVTKADNGSFVGKERDPEKWMRVHKSSVTWKYNVYGAPVSLQIPFRIRANSKRGVYVTFTDSSYHGMVTRSELGVGIGTVVSETEHIRLLEGTMNSYPFAVDPVGPKIFFGRIRYFSTLACNSAAECNDNIDGTEDKCIQGLCNNTPIPGICGNNVCEVPQHNEHCSSCPNDCDDAVGVCSHLNGIVTTGGTSTSSGDKGLLFTTKALKDLTIYEIHAAITTYTESYNVKLYTKMGVFNGNSDLSPWDLVFSGTVERYCTSGRFCNKAILKIPFTSTKFVTSPAGTSRTFYLDLSRSPLRYGEQNAIAYSNADLQVFSGSMVGQDLNSIGDNNMKFSGLLKYDYGLLKRSCSSSADCDDNNSGTEDTCVAGSCRNNPIPGICGNGICENVHNEYCSTCPADCVAPDYCDALDQNDTTGLSASSSVRGIAFDIDALQSLSVYELSFRVFGSNDVGAKVYTKEGSYKDNTSLSGWSLVFDKDNLKVQNRRITLPFGMSSPTVTDAGSKRSYYVTLTQGTRLLLRGDQNEGAVVVENSDIKVYTGEAYNTAFGSPSKSDFKKFNGALRYDFTEMEAPSFSPTIDTASTPTPAPTSTPSKSPVVEANGDSPFKIMITRNGKKRWKFCSWIRINPSRRCGSAGVEYDRISSHCPGTCGIRVTCTNSKAEFDIGSQNIMTCDRVEKEIANPCLVNGIADTCRAICPRDIEGFKFFAGINDKGNTKKKNCSWLRSQISVTQNLICNKPGDKGMSPASEVCVSTCDSCQSSPAPTAAPTPSPTKTPEESCRIDSTSERFFMKVKNDGSINSKGCQWLQKLKIKAVNNAQKMSKLWSICGSDKRNGGFRTGGEVCPATCENHKLFYKTTNKQGIDVKKTCLWLGDARRDETRDRICSKTDTASDGMKSAKDVCFLACKTCPEN